jgi:hypothetical protein
MLDYTYQVGYSRIWFIYQLLALPRFLVLAKMQRDDPSMPTDRVEGIIGRPKDPTG